MSGPARVVAVANQKGGVGKTTSAINIAASLALSGQRTLLIDLDPQANLTSGVGLRGQCAPAGTVYQALLTDEAPESFLLPSPIEGLWVVPADPQLTGAEIELVSIENRELRLRRLVASWRSQFDIILIDCPPSLGLLTLNALVASDTVLIPLHCEYFALEGLAALVGTMQRVQAGLNPTLDIEGVILTMHDDRTNLVQQVAREVREFFGEKVFRTTIPRNVRLGEAPSHGLPGVIYDPKSRGSLAYVSLAREMIERHAA